MRTLNADDMDPYFVQGWIQITDQVKDILLEFLTKNNSGLKVQTFDTTYLSRFRF